MSSSSRYRCLLCGPGRAAVAEQPQPQPAVPSLALRAVLRGRRAHSCRAAQHPRPLPPLCDCCLSCFRARRQQQQRRRRPPAAGPDDRRRSRRCRCGFPLCRGLTRVVRARRRIRSSPSSRSRLRACAWCRCRGHRRRCTACRHRRAADHLRHGQGVFRGPKRTHDILVVVVLVIIINIIIIIIIIIIITIIIIIILLFVVVFVRGRHQEPRRAAGA
jgi:hypothetical protein